MSKKIDPNQNIIRQTFFGTGSRFKVRREKDKVSVRLTVTNEGVIPSKPTKNNGHFKVCLETVLIDPRKTLTPSNVDTIIIAAALKDGESVDLDALPNQFYVTLGEANNEIDQVQGRNPNEFLLLGDVIGVTTTNEKPKKKVVTRQDLIASEALKKLSVAIADKLDLTLEELAAHMNETGTPLEELACVLKN